MIGLFVFGTAEKGFPLHEKALADVPCVGDYRTAQPYPMFVAGPWSAPMMLQQPGKGYFVPGELYRIDDTRLAAIDGVELVGKPGDLCVSIEVAPLDSGPPVPAFTYMKKPDLAVPLHSGFRSTSQNPQDWLSIARSVHGPHLRLSGRSSSAQGRGRHVPGGTRAFRFR